MKSLWVDGRFSWAFVAALAYLTLWLLAVDIAWRLIVLSVAVLLIYAAAIGCCLALAIAFIARRLSIAGQSRRSIR